VNIAQVLLIGCAWPVGWLLIGRAHRLAGEETAESIDPGRISIVVPARNEATRLPRLLDALRDAPWREVLVVDDESEDATASVAASHGATVLTVPPRPPSWNGKAWACATGAHVASGDVLVFLDADVEPTAVGVLALAATALASGGLASAQPASRVEKPYEHLSGGPLLVTLLGAGTGPSPRRRWWRAPIAFGPAVGIPRTTYESLGGHAADPGAVDDDLALARAADRAGVEVTTFYGGDLLRYRMYPAGLAQLVEGWTKNLAVGAGGIPRLRLASCVAWVAAALSAAGLFVLHPSAVSAFAYLAYASQAHVVLRRAGFRHPATAALYPAALAMFLHLFVASLVASKARGSVRWRGRKLVVGGRA
jgi:4,4'-diaponeurosporenoate glycosyltransferase